MNAPTANATKCWRWFFIILETAVLVTFLSYWLADRYRWLRWSPHSEALSVALVVSVTFAWLFLLIVSPFFLRSLRGVALAGWIIAFGMLVFAALTPAL